MARHSYLCRRLVGNDPLWCVDVWLDPGWRGALRGHNLFCLLFLLGGKFDCHRRYTLRKAFCPVRTQTNEYRHADRAKHAFQIGLPSLRPDRRRCLRINILKCQKWRQASIRLWPLGNLRIFRAISLPGRNMLFSSNPGKMGWNARGLPQYRDRWPPSVDINIQFTSEAAIIANSISYEPP